MVGHVHELPEPVESATHVEVLEGQFGLEQPTVHYRVRFGSVNEDGTFVGNPHLRAGEVRVLPSEWKDFEAHQKSRGAPSQVRGALDWRHADVLSYLDEKDLWRRVF